MDRSAKCCPRLIGAFQMAREGEIESKWPYAAALASFRRLAPLFPIGIKDGRQVQLLDYQVKVKMRRAPRG